MRSARLDCIGMRTVVFLLVAILALCLSAFATEDADNSVISSNSENITLSLTDSHTGQTRDNQQNFNTSSLEENPSSNDSRIILHSADYLQQTQTVCEGGHSCIEGQWCSPTRKVCKLCAELEPWCNDTRLIHARYAVCENYCYQFQIDKTRQCVKQQQNVEQRFRYADQSRKALEKEVSRLKNKYKHCSDEKASIQNENEKRGDTIVRLTWALALIIVFAIIVLALILWKLRSPRCTDHRVENGPDDVLPEHMQNAGLVPDTPLLPMQEAPKSPVQANGTDVGQIAIAGVSHCHWG